MKKFICSFGMGSLLAGKFLVVEAHDIDHCSDILRDGVMLDAVASIYPEDKGLELAAKYGWQPIPGNKEPFATLAGVDWEMLRQQKLVLLGAIEDAGEEQEPEDRSGPLTGILHLLDNIQDQACLTLGEETVFGKSEE